MSFVTIKNDRRHGSNLDDDWVRWIESAYQFDRAKGEAVNWVVENILKQRREIGIAVQECLLNEHPRDFVDACFSVVSPPKSLSTFSVPEALRSVGSLREKGIGAGEILLLFMVPNAVWNPGEAIDVVLFNENWHIKQIRKSDRRAKMGGAKDTRYSNSVVANRLHQINQNFNQDVTKTLLRLHASKITECFGSMDDFWTSFNEEFKEREFSNVVGICYFDEDNNVVEFHRKQDIILVGATQGSYRVQAQKVIK